MVIFWCIYPLVSISRNATYLKIRRTTPRMCNVCFPEMCNSYILGSRIRKLWMEIWFHLYLVVCPWTSTWSSLSCGFPHLLSWSQAYFIPSLRGSNAIHFTQGLVHTNNSRSSQRLSPTHTEVFICHLPLANPIASSKWSHQVWVLVVRQFSAGTQSFLKCPIWKLCLSKWPPQYLNSEKIKHSVRKHKM